jgi:hypothetical protein
VYGREAIDAGGGEFAIQFKHEDGRDRLYVQGRFERSMIAAVRLVRGPGASLVRVLAVVVAALTMFGVAESFGAEGFAAEPGYDPPAGSRWIIEAETRGEEVRPEGSTASLIKVRAELTIEQKTPEGFRVSYVHRGATVEGNARDLPLQRAYMKILENVAIRASTDLAGRPLRIDNPDEARTAMRSAADGLAEQFAGRPSDRALFDQLTSELIEVDAERAVSIYLGHLALLAIAQNTGMKQGEFRIASKPTENPLGGDTLMSNERFELVEADAAAGRLKFVNLSSIEPGSMKDFMQSFARSLLAASGDSITPARIDLLVSSMVFSLDKRTEFDVVDGMTRKISEKSTTVFRGMEQNLTQTEARIITVTRAP